MRIVSGRFKGRKIRPPKGLELRPTTDFAKESLFNILGHMVEIEGCQFLDLFSGTGNISYELMSRGAEKGVAVDISNASHKFRQKMIDELHLQTLQSYRLDVFKFLNRKTGPFDLIFADPPYDLERLNDIPGLIFTSGLLKPEGLLVLEHPENHTFGKVAGFVEHRNYGRVNFSFFKAESGQQ